MTDTDPSLAGTFVFPASSGQERLWFLREFDTSGGAAYHLHGAFRVEGPLDRLALQRALNHLVARHEPLRTRFAHVDGRLAQVVMPGSQVTMSYVDLSGLGEREGDAEALRVSEQDGRRPFPLDHGPLLRVTVLRTGVARHVLLVTMHHIVADGWSIGVFLDELATCYDAFRRGEEPTLPDLPVQYADFTAWNQEWVRSAEYARERDYWTTRLAGAPQVLDLPTDHRRPPVQSFRGAATTAVVDAARTRVLRDLARRRDMSPYMVLLAGFQLLLSRYSGQTDLLVGTPVANRDHPDLEPLIGFFANTLVLRADLTDDPTVDEFLDRTRNGCLDAFAHQRFPFEDLVRELRPERAPSRNPVFQVMFAWEPDALARPRLGDVTLTRLHTPTTTAKFDLTLFVAEDGDALRLTAEYNTDLFERSTVDRMLRHYLVLLDGLTGEPGRRASALPLLSAEERDAALAASAGPVLVRPATTLHGLVEDQVDRAPGATALVHHGERLTYRELNRRANRIARRLLDLGVGVEDLVAIRLPRTPDLVATVLGVLKSGAAYVPLDPRHPPHRTKAVLRDARPKILITDHTNDTDDTEGSHGVPVLVPDQDPPGSSFDGNPETPVAPRDLAYVLYTSGSTGTPKGVAIEHRSATNLIHWALDTYTPDELAGTLAATSLCFDLSVFEIFTPLAAGTTVILTENALDVPTDTDPPVTLINTVPSAIAELLEADLVPPTTRVINLAGEALPADLVRQLHARTSATRVLNLYGPSEATTYVTSAELSPDTTDPVSIGLPIANTRAYLLDHNLQPVPTGTPGHLYLAGTPLARAYHHNPRHTATHFIPNPHATTPGDRLYRTGDLAHRDHDGHLHFHGRIDHQLKLHGHRIEPGDIESALHHHPHTREAIVVAHGERRDRKLLAYVAPTSPDLDHEELARDLRAHLVARLPHYMVPAGFVFLSRIPRNPNGKVDRTALPPPDDVVLATRRRHVAPRDRTEKRVAAVWGDLLGRDRVGVHDDFFDLGGNSLLAGRLVRELHREFGVRVPLREIFLNATVAHVASAINDLRALPGPTGAARGSARSDTALDDLTDDEWDALLPHGAPDLPERASTAKEWDR
ncbi:amino acid adenylation domain-containing protein [Streptoalloteichus tenebrarius]|uniref:Amino acid adenylation domain-containing protein n=1 Tax=Streptoalloteichus tenebrarius (strain ATCC 17920 / DSM 40477 / JCM 4838 / CBS 697.72 / NBRC 16177 / NCIMB 11028 / NRRL B-12390 / A12253. 1 / ISP 5477) TaxID=1933 RepID=A0ABT1HQM9_STRSD|nr:amino acid adenylation domain-containing protein [Streptoalloteichus tenebrarius]MCP2257821.1 amino acid adenylation domain-containing protein [Streptoalloteichus tenebrarius]BFE99816.1 hypothetical protein GCM10020241_14920 [Streptoalloteichus tenebrarius]